MHATHYACCHSGEVETYDDKYVSVVIGLAALMREPVAENPHHNDSGNPDDDIGGEEDRREAVARTSRQRHGDRLNDDE